MSIRFEGDVVYAVNAQRDLGEMVHAYLVAYRDICNGMNGVTIPRGEFFIEFCQLKEHGKLSARIYDRVEITTEHNVKEPVYDLGSGTFGSQELDPEGILYYRDSTEYSRSTHYKNFVVTIPIANLFDDDYRATLRQRKMEHDKQLAEQARQAEIAQAEKRLQELRSAA